MRMQGNVSVWCSLSARNHFPNDLQPYAHINPPKRGVEVLILVRYFEVNKLCLVKYLKCFMKRVLVAFVWNNKDQSLAQF